LSIPDWPLPDSNIEQSVARVLADGSWGAYSGAATETLQRRLAEYFGCTHVGLCSSGTIGVEIALRAVGVEAGDEVILAAYDFPGNFRSIELSGATPVLVDTAAEGYAIDPQGVEAATSPKTRALIVSHLHGQIAPLDELRFICRDRQMALIEDACQVPGAMWRERRLGTIGDVGVISFGGSKLLTAGRGGAMLTNDASLFQRSRIFCERGNDAFPLSQLQAAVLPPQIDKLDERNSRRLAMARMLLAELRQATELVVPIDPSIESVFYKLPLIDPGNSGQRDSFLQRLMEQGIDAGEGFRGFALRSKRRCRKVGPLHRSRRLATQTVLLHHSLLLADESTVGEAARRIAAAFIQSRNAE
jgi:dTDP-4-amino-4,6-dideoxygalactose transaminase